MVLIHGNGVTGEDWALSGLFQRLAANHRASSLIGRLWLFSAPRNKVWTASKQADLIAAALDDLAVEAPVVIAHSWGTLMPTPGVTATRPRCRPWADVELLLADAEARRAEGEWPGDPGAGRPHALDPLAGPWSPDDPARLQKLFAPAEVTEAFKEGFPTSIALRPSQLRASAGDTAMMPFEALSVARRYEEIECPVLLIAGDGDRIASFKHQSMRLADHLRGGSGPSSKKVCTAPGADIQT